jgi:glycosyltransferase involved in cell wall biosynthesis
MFNFSIVIPCFNAAETIADTLSSIQKQTFQDWEVLCIDDGSTDNTHAIVLEFSKHDARIKLASNPSKGPSSARNFGALNLAEGEILCFCDADDLWSPTKLMELKDAFSNELTDAVYGKVAFFENCHQRASAYSTVLQKPLSIPVLMGENPVCTMSNISIRRTLFTRANSFDERIVHNEDLEWLVRLVGNNINIVGLNSCHTYYRASHYGLSSDLNAMANGRKAVLRTAAAYGFTPDGASNAVYYRYLARRALRLGHGRTHALRYTTIGIIQSPIGFFSSPKRGLLTFASAICALFLPSPISRSLFSR